MTSENKTKNEIREMFITQDGERFLSLSTKDQENLINAVLIGYIERSDQNTI